METVLISDVAEAMAKLLHCVKQNCQHNVKQHTQEYLKTKAQLDAKLTNGEIGKEKHKKCLKKARRRFLDHEDVHDNMVCTIKDCTDMLNDTFYKFSKYFKQHCKQDPYCKMKKPIRTPYQLLKALDDGLVLSQTHPKRI